MKPYSKHNTISYHLDVVCGIYATAELKKLPYSSILDALARHYNTPAFEALTRADKSYVFGVAHGLLRSLMNRMGRYHVTSNGTFRAPIPSTESYCDIKESFHGYDETHRF